MIDLIYIYIYIRKHNNYSKLNIILYIYICIFLSGKLPFVESTNWDIDEDYNYATKFIYKNLRESVFTLTDINQTGKFQYIILYKVIYILFFI